MEANSSDPSKRPACDNCKTRKTKCDRGAPCSSCVAVGLNCRISRRALEKRQRVHISARYDEAMENMDRSLQEVSQALQKLLQNSERERDRAQESPKSSTITMGTGTHVADTVAFSDGYRGDSSFTAHVQRVTDTLRNAAANLELSITDPGLSDTMRATQMIQEAAAEDEPVSSGGDSPSSPLQVQYPELEGRSLPPLEQVLKLLRLVHNEKQRFFVDMPIIAESEFGELCQRVYFAINDYSLSAWIIVNIGLYYLFSDLDGDFYSQVGVTPSDIQAYAHLLSENLEAALKAMRLCQGPSMERIQAIILLGHYCMRSGRSSTAWSLITTASRMCIDLGWHRLPGTPETSDHPKERHVFWHVFVLDKGMAFTMGRTPSIQPYDVATELLIMPPEGGRGLYRGFVRFAQVIGDMHVELFSAAAQRESLQTRVERAEAFAARLIQVNTDAQESLLRSPSPMFQSASTLLEISMHCLVTIVYRIVPCDEPNPHPLQCNVSCIVAARKALSAIVGGAQTIGQRSPRGWTRSLNWIFSIVPFACFVVLAGNTVASCSSEDLALLSAAVTAIECISGSPSGKKLYEICKSFYELAGFSVARQTALGAPNPSANLIHPVDQPAERGYSVPLGGSESQAYENVMAPQDWDTVMNEFDVGLGAGAMASFLEPYMPFYGDIP